MLSSKIIATEKHDPAWFTQGFYRDNSGFFISSGLYGQSQLIYQTPQKTLNYALPKRYFAEGLTVIGNTLYLLTWKEQTLLLFDKTTLKKRGQIHYTGEGWGLTHNENEFIMSDGSKQLLFRDKQTFKVLRSITVNKLDHLNELEYINGIIWANRWFDDFLYAIHPKNGCVLGKLSIRSLRKQAVVINKHNVSNGIAYDKQRQGLWVTGKYWSKRFLIQLPSLDMNICSEIDNA